MSAPLSHEPEAREMIERGALFAVNHSGGKDSQAMLIRLLGIVPLDQLIVVHATLGRSEWPGALEHAQQQAEDAGVRFVVAKSSSRESFVELVQWRSIEHPDSPAFPSASNRQCTSDLKRDPIMRDVRGIAEARGQKLIVTCMGMRAQESPRRAKALPWSLDTRGSKAGRTWMNWLPIHGLTTSEVFATIRDAGQTPHPAYAAGNERLSCVFCILGSAGDARNGALHNPELFAEHVELEELTGFTMHRDKSLEDFAGITVADAFAGRRHLPIAGAPS